MKKIILIILLCLIFINSCNFIPSEETGSEENLIDENKTDSSGLIDIGRMDQDLNSKSLETLEEDLTLIENI